MERKIIFELARNNKAAMIAHAIEAGVMVIFCLMQVTAGMRSMGLFLLDLILGLGPVIAEIFFWKRNHETSMIKHLVAIGFAVFYTFTLFTCTNNLVFTFVIPMILMVSIFNDTKYSIEINAGTVILSIMMSIVGA